MVDFSGLKDLPTSDPTAWQPPDIRALCGPDLLVLCFDQSLLSTGVVLIHRMENYLKVLEADTIKPPSTSLKSFEQDYFQALHLQDEAERWIRAMVEHQQRLACQMRIVHETPAVSNPRMKRGARVGTPGRMGGQSVRSAAHRFALDDHIRMINAQQAKTHICGNSKADKKEAHGALTQWVAEVGPGFRGYEKVTNEHQRDGVLLGLKVLANEAGR